MLALFCPGSHRCCCWRTGRNNRLRSKGLRHILNEVSITHIIRDMRVLKASAKAHVSKAAWQELQDQHGIMLYTDMESDEQKKAEEKSASVEKDEMNFDVERP